MAPTRRAGALATVSSESPPPGHQLETCRRGAAGAWAALSPQSRKSAAKKAFRRFRQPDRKLCPRRRVNTAASPLRLAADLDSRLLSARRHVSQHGVTSGANVAPSAITVGEGKHPAKSTPKKTPHFAEMLRAAPHPVPGPPGHHSDPAGVLRAEAINALDSVATHVLPTRAPQLTPNQQVGPPDAWRQTCPGHHGPPRPRWEPERPRPAPCPPPESS